MRKRQPLLAVSITVAVIMLTACASDDQGQQMNPSTAAVGGVGGGSGGIAGVTTGGQGGLSGGGVGGVGGHGGAAGVMMVGGQGGAGGATMVGGQGGLAGGGTGGCASGSAACQDAGVVTDPDGGAEDPELCQVVDLPDDVRAAYDLDGFYTRTALAHGVPIVASDSPVDDALTRACLLIVDYASASAEVQQTLLDEKIYFIMMGADEKTVDTPEFRSLGDLDWRARGLGGVPAAICAEENVMCDASTDRWRGESICVHEYAHTMHLGVYNVAIGGFSERLEAAYDHAMDMGLYADTYAASQPAEYFAEGVQNWYNTNLETRSGNADGVHNHINTREELRQYDPELYELIADVLPAEPMYRDCYYYE